MKRNAPEHKMLSHKKGFLALMLTLSSAFMESSKAHAYILLDFTHTVQNNYRDYPIPTALSCMVFLPICLFDKAYDEAPTVSPQVLAENGYSSEEIKVIESDQNALLKKMADRKIGFTVLPMEKRKQIVSQLKSIHPEISDVYLKFFLQANGI